MKRRIAVITGLLVLVLAGVLLHAMSSPVNGHVIHTDDRLHLRTASSSHKPAPLLPPDSLQSAYFQLDLPAGYSIQPATATLAGLLYQQSLIKPSASGSMIIALAIKTLPAEGLDGDSSYVLRKQHPELYDITTRTQAGETVLIVTDKQSAAVTAFWSHHNYLATITVSLGISTPGNTDANQETAVLQSLLDSWHWR